MKDHCFPLLVIFQEWKEDVVHACVVWKKNSYFDNIFIFVHIHMSNLFLEMHFEAYCAYVSICVLRLRVY